MKGVEMGVGACGDTSTPLGVADDLSALAAVVDELRAMIVARGHFCFIGPDEGITAVLAAMDLPPHVRIISTRMDGDTSPPPDLARALRQIATSVYGGGTDHRAQPGLDLHPRVPVAADPGPAKNSPFLFGTGSPK